MARLSFLRVLLLLLGIYGNASANTLDIDRLCGPFCTYAALKYMGYPASLEELVSDLAPSDIEVSLAEVNGYLKKTYNLETCGLRCSLSTLPADSYPVIAHCALSHGEGQKPSDHFVLLTGRHGDTITGINPPQTFFSVTVDDLVPFTTGSFLVLGNAPTLKRTNRTRQALLFGAGIGILSAVCLAFWSRRPVRSHRHGPEARSIMLVLFFSVVSGMAHASDSQNMAPTGHVDMTRPGGAHSIKSQHFDAGSVPMLSDFSHTFRLHNSSTVETITITSAKASCGCLDHKIEDTLIPPGGDTAVVMSMRIEHPGNQVATLWIKDQSGRAIALSLAAMGFSDVAATPAVLDFGDVTPAGQSTLTTRVSCNDAETTLNGFHVIKSPAFVAAVNVTQINAVELEVSLTLCHADNHLTGPLRSELVMTLDGPKQKEIRIPVFASFEREIRATPERIYFRSSPATSTLLLESTTGKALKVRDVHCDKDLFSIERQSSTPASCLLKLTLSKSSTESPLKGTITVDLEDVNEAVAIPYYILGKPRH